MPASRARVRGSARASANGACHARTDVTGPGRLSRLLKTGVRTPTTTAPSAARRRALDVRRLKPGVMVATRPERPRPDGPVHECAKDAQRGGRGAHTGAESA